MTDTTVVPAAPTFDPILARAKALTDKLWNDKDVGSKVRATAKELFPDINIPEDTVTPVVQPLMDELKALREERAADKQAAEEAKQAAETAKADQTLREKLEGTKSKFSLSEAGFDAVVERMKETGNFAAPDDAAAYVLRNEKPAAVAPGAYLGPQDINLYGSSEKDEERFGLLHRDPMGKFLDAEFREFTADPEAYVREAGVA